ncbi:BCSC C-terminal domain-containing protein [Hyphomonas sp. WL0036]|uniref:cellulose synthase subunit BcsC-related outer membrane protein n=1 Tax=Hyphomonas sediminis TaxID=2866160 RepID=UPI001C812B66|nr:cellulose synthase subunit BcsC-related outer membrane protein [Hyphomonas sediminis]MBY9065730.1 BCSC C-terminal domain-containing protein [Hyphomonas sediminis]
MKKAAAFLNAALVSVGAMLLLGMNAEAAPETGREGVYSIGIPVAAEHDIADMATLPALKASPGPSGADVESVWALGAAGDWGAAESQLSALRGRHPGWQAPADLAGYVSTGLRQQRIQDALGAKNWAGALALLPAEKPGVCEPASQLWARAEALEGQGEPSALQDFYVRELTNCRAPELAAALAQRALSVLDANGLEAAARIPALAASNEPGIMAAYSALAREAAWQHFVAAEAAGDLASAAQIAEHSADTRVLAQAGWLFLAEDAGKSAVYFQAALALEETESARRGLAQAALATEDFGAARQAIAGAPQAAEFSSLSARADLGEARLARKDGNWKQAVDLAGRAMALDPALKSEAEAVGGGALLDAAGQAYDAGDFAGARALAQQAAGYPAVRRAAEMRMAWAALQDGEAELASASFSQLYLAIPDNESAEGFALAAQKTGTLDSAASIARAVGGPLGAKVQAQYAATAFYAGDYLTARALAPDTYEALDGVDHTIYRQTVSMRQQDGARGENRLTGYAATSSIEMVRGVSRYEIGLTLYKLDTGAAGGAGRESFAAPYLGWSREGKTSLAARVGLLPIGGGADTAVTGEIAAARNFGKHSGEARAFVRPRTDSALAFAGGDTGRIQETGLSARGRLDVGSGRAVQADVTVSRLDGRGVVDNDMISTGVSASQSIKKDGFAYLVTGPFYQFQAYDRNTNFFSAGHGGYFSPQEFHRAGWSVNARTEPLKDWLVKADAAVAFESVREGSAFEFPLESGGGARFGGGRSSGVAGAIDVALAHRIGPEVIISANLSATASKAFEDLRAGIGFIWVPGGRAGLVPTDLSTDPFSPGSWIRP